MKNPVETLPEIDRIKIAQLSQEVGARKVGFCQSLDYRAQFLSSPRYAHYGYAELLFADLSAYQKLGSGFATALGIQHVETPFNLGFARFLQHMDLTDAYKHSVRLTLLYIFTSGKHWKYSSDSNSYVTGIDRNRLSADSPTAGVVYDQGYRMGGLVGSFDPLTDRDNYLSDIQKTVLSLEPAKPAQ